MDPWQQQRIADNSQPGWILELKSIVVTRLSAVGHGDVLLTAGDLAQTQTLAFAVEKNQRFCTRKVIFIGAVNRTPSDVCGSGGWYQGSFMEGRYGF